SWDRSIYVAGAGQWVPSRCPQRPVLFWVRLLRNVDGPSAFWWRDGVGDSCSGSDSGAGLQRTATPPESTHRRASPPCAGKEREAPLAVCRGLARKSRGDRGRSPHDDDCCPPGPTGTHNLEAWGP